MKTGFFETVGDSGDITQGYCGRAVGGDNFDLFEFAGPLTSFLESQQHLAGIGFDRTCGNIFTGSPDHAGYLAECQPILAQSVLGNLYMGHVIRRIPQFYLGDDRVREKAVPQLFGQFSECPDVDRAVQHDIHYLAPA